MSGSDRRHTTPERASKGTRTDKSGTSAPEDAALHPVSYSPSIFVMQLLLLCVLTDLLMLTFDSAPSTTPLGDEPQIGTAVMDETPVREPTPAVPLLLPSPHDEESAPASPDAPLPSPPPSTGLAPQEPQPTPPPEAPSAVETAEVELAVPVDFGTLMQHLNQASQGNDLQQSSALLSYHFLAFGT